MASPKTIAIVKSTAPVLEVHGEEITKVFYRRLFENNPELKDMFNMTNQKKGTQPKALANAIFKYACHIDKLELLGDAVASITEKHSSLSITPEMYPIVGKNLLDAIKEVLGDAATPDVIDAWAEAYDDLAVIFMSSEEKIYEKKESNAGGFRGKKNFVVFKKEEESSVITSFYLKPKDGSSVPEFIPGQYIVLTIDVPGTTHKHTRNYSLSDSNNKDYLRISVKKETYNPEGIVSNYLHSNIIEGDVLSIGIPSGDFVLNNSEKPVVLLAGGVGITPLMSMYKSILKDSKREVVFIQCALNSETHAFKKEIQENLTSKSKSVIVYNEPLVTDIQGDDYDFSGYLTANILKDIGVDSESVFYFCGPTPFMANAIKVLNELDVEESNINYEFFGPSEELMCV
ncbi:MAG: NO-inducible flavohemoprotein [Flavobacteriaceae bacterium]|nr:NO-inducible flavohemoprotein [Flavobacteriaceae bacterium]